MVRYRVKPDRVEENEELIRSVYEELAEFSPSGFRYATFVLEDGRTFVHFAVTEDGHESPLSGVAAFKRFTADIADRVDEPPQTTQLPERVGGYGL